ncbi:MAG: thiopeptide-type bacteriocin biosynthesis protein, partial [Balneolaceae bacterium]
MKHQWLSAHIFYSEPFEGILINGVKPFIEKLKKEKKIEGYFFIRYWERGPHIRLRIKADSHILKDDIKPRLLSYFTEFMRESPSKRNEPKWVQNLTSGKQWYSNNSIQFINYEPETARYGG